MNAIEQLEQEVVRLSGEVERSAANHNYLIGALRQTQNILAQLKAEEKPEEAAAESVPSVSAEEANACL